MQKPFYLAITITVFDLGSIYTERWCKRCGIKGFFSAFALLQNDSTHLTYTLTCLSLFLEMYAVNDAIAQCEWSLNLRPGRCPCRWITGFTVLS